jgi:hypothetical protein
MNLSDTIERIIPAVVALGYRLEVTQSNTPPNFPMIVGTGFVVDERGMIATNRHVAEALKKYPNKDRFVAFFRQVPMENDMLHVGVIFRKITMWYSLSDFRHDGRYFGETKPDLEFLTVDLQGLHSLPINGKEGTLRIGMDVVSVGFPSGRDRLSPHGGEIPSQLTPFARRGIISSVLPCPCLNPHGFTVDVLSEGGASGSPICSAEDGNAVGLLYAGWEGEPITLGVPGHILANGLASVLSQWEPDSNLPAMSDLTKRDFNSPELPMKWDFLGRVNMK